jgi:hypothetical protein
MRHNRPVGEPRVSVGCAIATTAAQGPWSRSPWLGTPPKVLLQQRRNRLITQPAEMLKIWVLHPAVALRFATSPVVNGGCPGPTRQTELKRSVGLEILVLHAGHHPKGGRFTLHAARFRHRRSRKARTCAALHSRRKGASRRQPSRSFQGLISGPGPLVQQTHPPRDTRRRAP